MDTMTYASIAALPWSVAQNRKQLLPAEAEFTPLNLSYIAWPFRVSDAQLGAFCGLADR